MRQMKKIMNKSNDTGTINTVVKTAIKNANALEDGKLDAVAGGWAANPTQDTALWAAIRNRARA
jgi:hypothetical protein